LENQINSIYGLLIEILPKAVWGR